MPRPNGGVRSPKLGSFPDRARIIDRRSFAPNCSAIGRAMLKRFARHQRDGREHDGSLNRAGSRLVEGSQ